MASFFSSRNPFRMHSGDSPRRAFTLLETLITLTLFAVIGVVTVNTLVTGLRASKKVEAEVRLYAEASGLMNRIGADISNHTVDYEAYFAREVLGEDGFASLNYGAYAQAFYNPGTGGVEAPLGEASGHYANVPEHYRAVCPDGVSLYPVDCPNERPVYTDQDFDTGVHPFDGIHVYGYDGAPDSMNAFCESDDASLNCSALEEGFFAHLILINPHGDKRLIYGREIRDVNLGEYTLSRLRMNGEDSDSNGAIDLWSCDAAYDCSDGSPAQRMPDPDDLTTDDDLDATGDFLPMLPPDVDVTDFWVQIVPFEDPFLAFAETDMQIQPMITVGFTLRLSPSLFSGLLGELPSITLQRSFSTTMNSAIESYR